jgi:hypothetical protein
MATKCSRKMACTVKVFGTILIIGTLNSKIRKAKKRITALQLTFSLLKTREE